MKKKKSHDDGGREVEEYGKTKCDLRSKFVRVRPIENN